MTKPLNVLREDFPELAQWIKSICRYGSKLEDFIIADYKENRLHLKFYTKDHCYSISARLPKKKGNWRKDHLLGKDDSYLGCMVMTRKPRAGEDWNRGNDLADGIYNQQTWREIVRDIIGYELVRVVKPKETKQLD